MTVYKEYIKGGEILIAPSLKYEDQYVLKCCECEEYHSLLESFLSHCLSHYGLEPKKERVCPETGPLQLLYADEEDADAVVIYDFSRATGFEQETEPDECNEAGDNVVRFEINL